MIHTHTHLKYSENTKLSSEPTQYLSSAYTSRPHHTHPHPYLAAGRPHLKHHTPPWLHHPGSLTSTHRQSEPCPPPQSPHATLTMHRHHHTTTTTADCGIRSFVDRLLLFSTRYILHYNMLLITHIVIHSNKNCFDLQFEHNYIINKNAHITCKTSCTLWPVVGGCNDASSYIRVSLHIAGRLLCRPASALPVTHIYIIIVLCLYFRAIMRLCSIISSFGDTTKQTIIKKKKRNLQRFINLPYYIK